MRSGSFATLPPAVQVQLAGAGPLLFGALSGFLLGESALAYWVAQALAAVGGLAAGLDHLGARAGALRGVLGGALFGGGLVVAHATSGQPALASVPSPLVVLIAFTTVAGALLGAIGGAVRARGARRA